MLPQTELLNLKHIINFINARWKLTKKEIASDYLQCGHTKLSKVFYEDQATLDKLFTDFFDLTNEDSVASTQNEDEIRLLTGLKEYLMNKGYKDCLEDIWSESYENFVRGCLRKANKRISLLPDNITLNDNSLIAPLSDNISSISKCNEGNGMVICNSHSVSDTIIQIRSILDKICNIGVSVKDFIQLLEYMSTLAQSKNRNRKIDKYQKKAEEIVQYEGNPCSARYVTTYILRELSEFEHSGSNSSNEKAMQYYIEAKPLLIKHELTPEFAKLLISMGKTAKRLGFNKEHVKKCYEDALKLSRSIKNKRACADALKLLGDLEYEAESGNLEEAKGCYCESEKLYKDERYDLGLMWLYRSMYALELLFENGGDIATQYFNSAEALAAKLKTLPDNSFDIAVWQRTKAIYIINVCLFTGTKPVEAIPLLNNALECYKREIDGPRVAKTYAVLAYAHALCDNVESAYNCISKAYKIKPMLLEHVAKFVDKYIKKAEDVLCNMDDDSI